MAQISRVTLKFLVLLFVNLEVNFAARTSKYDNSRHTQSQSNQNQRNNHSQVYNNATSQFNSSSTTTSDSSPCLNSNNNGIGCPNVGIDMKKLSIEIIRHDILRKLHMDENNLPNITTKNFPIPSAYLSDFINTQNDTPALEEEEEVDEDSATTEKVIAFSRMQQVKMNGKETRSAHYFTFSNKLIHMKIDEALLHLKVRYSPSNGASDWKWPEYRIKIFEIIHRPRGESIVSISHGPFKPYIGQIEGQSPRHYQSEKWVQINVKNILTKWLEKITVNSDRKIGFVLEAVDLRDNISPDINVMMSTSEVDANINPFIVIKISEIHKTRHPRNIGMDCNENSRETRCCRFPLVIDFEEFGWDWIIAPKKYDANYCSGECPYAFLQKYPHNHIIQQTGVGGGPCCAARKMSPITMLYFDKESNIVFSVLNGMVVDKCGCS